MFADLQCWIKSCVSCAQKKRDVHHSKSSLLPIPVSGPWEVIAADCMDPLPQGQIVTNLGNRYILFVGHLFTKYIKTAALPSIETAIITQVFLDKVVFRHSPPHRFLTDRGTNFTSKLKTQLCNDLNIHMVFTSGYHPKWDGFVECINDVIIANNRYVCGLRPQRLGYIFASSHICLQHQSIWNHRWHSFWNNPNFYSLNVLVCCCAANQYSKITFVFSKILRHRTESKG